jgi:hypothetical protein
MQRFLRGEKRDRTHGSLSIQRITPIMKNTFSTLAVFMGKEIMYHSKKSCYRIPIHYDPEL